MKIFYTRICSVLAIAALVITLNVSVKAQPTVLVAGDIAFTGYHSATAVNDSFSFVLLKAVNATTVIHFTDNAWLNPGVFRVGESNITLTFATPQPAGREITIGLFTAPHMNARIGCCTSVGTVTSTAGPNPFAFSTVGDQVIAYQGTPGAPTFIGALHMNIVSTDIAECGNTTAATWDPDCFDGAGGTVGNTNFSKIPAGMVSGTNVHLFPTPGVNASDRDNAKFTGCGLALSTAAQVRTAVLNSANWGTSSNTNPPGFGLPSGCAFMGLAPLPVSLVSFTGRLNSDKTVTLQWKVEAQQDIQEYIVEESLNGADFTQLGAVPAVNGMMHTYSFIDMQVATGNNYYRLKTMELNGTHSYSEVVVVNLKAGIKVNVYPNPVTDKLTIQQFGVMQNKTAVLYDGKGNMLQQIRLTNLSQEVNMRSYPAGIYIVKMEDGEVFKIVKQ